jgi:hypothetical protein
MSLEIALRDISHVRNDKVSFGVKRTLMDRQGPGGSVAIDARGGAIQLVIEGLRKAGLPE